MINDVSVLPSCTVYRYVVSVDDQTHAVELSGPIVHVAARTMDKVEFWALVGNHNPAVRIFQVFGTGHSIPRQANYVGTALAGPLVWHLFELSTSDISKDKS